MSLPPIKKSVPDPNYTPDPQEQVDRDAAFLRYQKLVAAYDVLIEDEINDYRRELLRGLRSDLHEDNK